MDQLRRITANIQEQVGKMTASQKLLLASLVVIAVMTLFVVSQYAAKPSMVDLMGAGSDVDTINTLKAGGFNAEMIDGRLVIPEGQQRYALAYLSESGKLPGDTTLLFSNLIGSQDWKASSQQHRQQYNIALQNELSQVISRFSGVARASVILDIPQTTGLGRAARPATASATVFSSDGGSISQDKVDATARLIAGAVSGLTPERVQVIDGSTGRARTTSDDDSQSSSRYLEYATQVEKHTQRKIEGLFGHIPGVVVSITARVDITRVQSTENLFAPDGEGTVSVVKSDRKTSSTSQQATQGAEPGVRSNQTASINTGGGAEGALFEDETGDTEFDTAIGQRTRTIIDPRGMPTHMSASVIIPQEYIESIIMRSRPAEEGEEAVPVTAQEAEEFFATARTTFENIIEPHLMSVDDEGVPVSGNLTVTMAPLGGSMISSGGMQRVGFLGSLAGGGGGGGGGSAMGAPGQLVETVLVGVLAVVSLGMMTMMVRRSGKKIELPSAEKLVGVPPHLENSGDLIGEASEGDHVMTGIEVDDQVVEVQQLREQVSEMVRNDPEAAAGLVERWAEHAEM
ncbi:MAG: flagellar M-ring protein FliF C-terminal domain-containing protein [Phycisphaerales bacterium]